VHIIKKGPRVCVIFKGGDKFSPFRFENYTLDNFKIKQRGQSLHTNLLPYHCCAYAWDDPLAPHVFTIEVHKNDEELDMIGEYTFDRLQNLGAPKARNRSYLFLRVVAQGPTRVLQIFDSRNSTSNPSPLEQLRGLKTKEIPQVKDSLSMMPTNSITEKVSSVLFDISLGIKSIGISIVDHTPQELIFLSFSNVKVDHTTSIDQESLSINLERFQIDNQLCV
jgi:vacuolar protein sorting-associated protein 13A/C